MVNDGDTAKECLTTKDLVFATRPKTLAGETMGYNYAMFGLGPTDHIGASLVKLLLFNFFPIERLTCLDVLENLR